MELWAKAPILENKDLLIASQCLKHINPEVWKSMGKNKVVLTACPENDCQAIYGKIASMIRSTKPKSITVITIDGSPHCYQLQAAVNEAEYILGEKFSHEHYVLVDGVKLVKINPNAIRLARYLSIIDKALDENPKILEELEKHSLEYRFSRELSKIHGK